MKTQFFLLFVMLFVSMAHATECRQGEESSITAPITLPEPRGTR